MIRTLLVDDENLIRQTLQIYLESEQNIEIIATADNGSKAIALVEQFQPDVILIDIEMPEMDGLTATELLLQRCPKTKIIVLTSHDESTYINRALTAGATGYLLKSLSPQELSKSIELVHQGYLQIAPGLSHKLKLAETQTTSIKDPKKTTVNTVVAKSDVKDSFFVGYEYNSLPQDANLLPLVEPDEFLPAVSRWTTRGAMILLGIFGTSLFLAHVLKYKTTVNAAAKIRPVGELRTVQSATVGRVTEIKVKANQAVKQGDIIATINSSGLQTQKNQLQQKLKETNAQLLQTKAQIADLDDRTNAEIAASTRIIASGKADLEFNQQQYQQQTTTTQAELDAAKAGVQLATEELARYQQLSQTGAVSQLQISEKKAALQAAFASQKQAQAATTPSNANVIKAQASIDREQARGKAKISALNLDRKTLVEKQISLSSQIKSDRYELQQLQNDLEQTIIRATASGIVQQLNLRNSGQVVNSGDEIATIFPSNSNLMVTANVATQDIGKVEVGQNVQIKVSACPYPDYGILSGVVETVSPDAIEPMLGSDGDGYRVTIEPQQNFIGTSNKCRIESGMKGDAYIVTQEESAIDFLLRKARLKTKI